MEHRTRRRISRGLAVALAFVFCCSFAALPAGAETAGMGATLTDEEGESVTVSEAERTDDAEALAALAADAALNTDGKLAAAFKRYQTLGAVVCVIENGRISHTYCYGSLDRKGTPITADTLFRVGSISKMVTAMGILKLAEEGRVTLDGDLSDWLGFPVRNARYPATPLTLRQLMSHTTGLRDNGHYTLALRGQAAPLATLFGGSANKYLFVDGAEAGTVAQYTNFGGGILGSVLESVTGQTVDAYLKETIFDPLGVTAAYQTALLPETAVVSDQYDMPSRVLSAKVRDGAPAALVPDPQADYTLTAGKLTISAPGLAKIVIALCDGGIADGVRVLRESSVAAMREPQNGIGSVSCQSGWGLCLNILPDTPTAGRTIYGHGGKSGGMLCAAYFDPNDRTGVVMLTNGCDNRPVRNGVGMLSLAVIRLCYAGLIDGRHVTEDPWLVDGP
ncbi:MAG: beta-lactamase family protein [Clostridiales bacterium]|nr:beta-lactamase family protein [Clostridiales bacterium]